MAILFSAVTARSQAFANADGFLIDQVITAAHKTRYATMTDFKAFIFASPTIVTPTIASFANANHTHADSAGGGQITSAAFATGAISSAQLATILSDEEGSGGGFVRATSPTLTTPTVATSLTASFLTASTLVFTNGSSQLTSTVPTGCITSANLATMLTDETGSGGGFVRANSATMSDLNVVASAAGTIPLIAKGAASQTANLQEWQNSGASALSLINKDGKLGVRSFDANYAATIYGVEGLKIAGAGGADFFFTISGQFCNIALVDNVSGGSGSISHVGGGIYFSGTQLLQFTGGAGAGFRVASNFGGGHCMQAFYSGGPSAGRFCIALDADLVDNSSTILNLVSTAYGLGIPAMTTTQRGSVGTSRTGLLLHDTTLAKGFLYTTGWEKIMSHAGLIASSIVFSDASGNPTSTIQTGCITSANLKTMLTDEIGAGKAVFSDSPTVSGSRALPEQGLKDLLAKLSTLGIITDTTTT